MSEMPVPQKPTAEVTFGASPRGGSYGRHWTRWEAWVHDDSHEPKHWKCGHSHWGKDIAEECARREIARRG